MDEYLQALGAKKEERPPHLWSGPSNAPASADDDQTDAVLRAAKAAAEVVAPYLMEHHQRKKELHSADNSDPLDQVDLPSNNRESSSQSTSMHTRLDSVATPHSAVSTPSPGVLQDTRETR